MEKAIRLKGTPVTVTGATGFIGRHLVKRLLREEARIEIITRRRRRVPHEWRPISTNGTRSPRPISIIEEDMAEGVTRLAPRTEIVFHCAGEARDPQHFYRTNVDGTRNILNACIRNGVKKFVYLSSVGVIGAEKAGTFDETSPCFPKNDYEQSKLEAEKLVLETGQREGLSVAVLRPSIVYGPGKPSERDSFLSLTLSIKKGYFCYIGGGSGIYNIVYLGDVVEALLFLAVSSSVREEKIFIINDPIIWGEFVSYVQSLLHVKRKVRAIPEVLALPLALGCELGKVLGIKMPFSISRFKALTSKTRFSSESLKKEPDFKFLYGNHEGIKDTIGYYRQNNLL